MHQLCPLPLVPDVGIIVRFPKARPEYLLHHLFCQLFVFVASQLSGRMSVAGGQRHEIPLRNQLSLPVLSVGMIDVPGVGHPCIEVARAPATV